MYDAYHTLISQKKRSEIQHIEVFDEVEEWKLIMEHYCLTISVKQSQSATESIPEAQEVVSAVTSTDSVDNDIRNNDLERDSNMSRKNRG
eukprot:CAMPEP_0182430652 /NCGR_PEP_ID=MMETSP1167-20130531/42297_1 /TAXON_ID=2988 /ORGANISM="Mallomonas Sp, Strain CCMP3275" /LENGTH=89 /DNA_ID=CAMNT_0024615995 /DNA_START=126 /DNA_END=391 /DNA_ORIENTATION=+